MTTPTCPACGTKFPGKDTCKGCGLPMDASRKAIVQVQNARRVEKASNRGLANKKGKKVPKVVVKGRLGSTQRKRRKHGRPV